MPVFRVRSAKHCPFIRPGFQWDAADCYLFDIDGTLLNSRDAVHYQAFHHAIHELCDVDVRIDGIPVHGNTDPGILRDVLRRAAVDEAKIAACLSRIVERMCAEVKSKRQELAPELCPSIPDLLTYLSQQGKLLGVASGNLEPVGWAKIEKAGLRPWFSFGGFSWPRETRAEIFSYGVAAARQRLGPTASVCVIGDTPSDIAAAHVVGVPVIALATGIFSFDQLLACTPDACLDCATDLLAHS